MKTTTLAETTDRRGDRLTWEMPTGSTQNAVRLDAEAFPVHTQIEVIFPDGILSAAVDLVATVVQVGRARRWLQWGKPGRRPRVIHLYAERVGVPGAELRARIPTDEKT